MNILELAEQNFLITFSVVIGIGLLQGAIMGRGIRSRFPSLKKHARSASIVLLALFSINAIASVLKFAEPVKISVSEITIPETIEEVFTLIVNVIGINAGVGAAIAIFVSVTLIIFLKFANIHQIARYFIFVISCAVLIVVLLGKFTDFVPTAFQIMLYAFYQFGITVGIFLVTKRKETEALSEIK